jgi:alkylation response protein AidB-like acyl-CoA dehydrogenase
VSLDRAELQDSARRMFGEAGLAPDRAANWSLIAEMGWLGLAAPEELGGLGQGREALATLYTELGRVLAPAPVLPALMAVEAVSKASELRGREAWIERIVGGERITASLKGGSVQIGPAARGDGFAVTGNLSAVPDADEASHLIVWSEDGGLCALLALNQPEFVEATPRASWDKSRRLFDVDILGAALKPSLVLARDEEAEDLVRDLQTHLLFGLAADSLGGAAAALEMTLDYLQTRKQFARPLAMFQALKHRCADLKAQISAAEALLWTFADGRGSQEPLLQAAGLKAYASSVFHAVVEETIQLHGGIGLTAEHPCHLFLKRALLNEALAGGVDAWDLAVGAEAFERLAP